MTLFDLLFLFAALCAVVSLAVALAMALARKRARAVRVLRVLGICAVAYLAVGLMVSLVKPQRVGNVGESWCFDDWCLEAQSVARTSAPPSDIYRVELRMFSRARRISQRANAAWIFLIDERGNRYAPEPDPAGVPLDARLEPGQSIATARVFRVPREARNIGLITGHGSAYCGVMDFLVIGESGCIFHKPAMIRIP